MADEFFYGATLTGVKNTIVWNPQEKEDEEFADRGNKLIVKQILLGVEAKENEYNVVEVETTAKDEIIKIPIAVLKVGENRVSQSFLEFPDAPVTFRLIKGEGPVHIHGHHLLGEFDAADMEDLEEEGLGDEEDDSENEIRAGDSDEPKSKKMKVAGNNAKAVKNEKNNKKK